MENLETTLPQLGKVVSGQKFTVVHGGARDAYQVALALEERGMLDELVTDLFWPADRPWASRVSSVFPRKVRNLLASRAEYRLRSSHVQVCAASGLASLLLSKIAGVPFTLRRGAMRLGDSVLGRTAGIRARRRGSRLLSYSYYGYDAFTHYGRCGTLFQLHPHPASMRRILSAELLAHPDCASSLKQEWELALDEQDFRRLSAEPAMAESILVASSFTASTLVEQGIAPEKIQVVPYGVDAQRFSPGNLRDISSHSKLKLLFVGRINQRKGIKYLLEAIRLLDSKQIELTVCGRVVDDLAIFKPFAQTVTICPNVNAEELVNAYRSADLFVFPSVAEGFGQVLLESLACGLPVVSTTRTAAPDLIESGREGFIVDPCNAEQLAVRIEWALTHRNALASMRKDARAAAERFTWASFRSQVIAALERNDVSDQSDNISRNYRKRRSSHAL